MRESVRSPPGVLGRERLLTVIDVILRLEKGAGLRFAFRMGEGERTGEPIRFTCRSGIFPSSFRRLKIAR